MALIKIKNPKSARNGQILEADINSASAITHDENLYFKAREYDLEFVIPSTPEGAKSGDAHREIFKSKTKWLVRFTIVGSLVAASLCIGAMYFAEEVDTLPKVIGWPLVVLILCIPIVGVGRGCSVCGGWWCLEEIGKEPIGEKTERVSDTDRIVHRNSRGEITGTSDVPVTRVEITKKFQEVKKCEYCGSQHVSVSEEKA